MEDIKIQPITEERPQLLSRETKTKLRVGLNDIVNIKKFIPTEITEAMKKFDGFFRKCLPSESPLLNEVLRYIFDKQGKRIRSLCVFMSAAVTRREFTETTYAGASAIEMIHTASILHDDVIDCSDRRRGNKSVNAEWNSKIAILTGDYLLARALMLVTEYNMYDFMKIMSHPIVEMSEGEMIQISESEKLNIAEKTYFDIIRKKTAVLIGASMQVGAKSTGAVELADLMYDTGENIGMAFQIKDDMFDFGKTGLLGKPTGNDVVERKITLPLIYALKQVDKRQRNLVIQHIIDAADDKHSVTYVRDFVIEHHGLEYAAQVAQQYVDKATAQLSSLDDSPAKQALIKFAQYMLNREK
jgi:octaprenyl-diphosphate synthase